MPGEARTPDHTCCPGAPCRDPWCHLLLRGPLPRLSRLVYECAEGSIDVGAPSVEAKVTPPPTPTNAPDHWEHEEPREREDARGASTSPAPMAVPPDVVDETSNTSSEGDQGESIERARIRLPEIVKRLVGPVTDGKCGTRSTWNRTEPCHRRACFPGTRCGELPAAVIRAHLPPPNPDELPIVSCGRYVLPDAEHGPPDPSSSDEKQPPGSTSPAPAPANAPAPQPGPVTRDRSRSTSPLRGGDGPAGAEPSHPSSLDNKHHRPKMHGLSSDSDAPPTAKSQKLDTPPSGKGHTPPSAGGKLN
ncbi:translation initiation factor IF-2-like [Rhipicephalus sanguineus]|uniref:translation initiation factor IF-2-like n=1 Tax=Rhipicephalus sanguineus TaxID=34632 RepID=UPI0020C24591|nr:translation initiation factor IF-2-like [Rhipicephalus sanguineus]